MACTQFLVKRKGLDCSQYGLVDSQARFNWHLIHQRCHDWQILHYGRVRVHFWRRHIVNTGMTHKNTHLQFRLSLVMKRVI